MSKRDKNLIFAALRQKELIDESLSVSVKINWKQALTIVVDDLVKKYIYNRDRGDEEWARAFLKVLSYYLEPHEIEAMTTRPAAGAEQEQG